MVRRHERELLHKSFLQKIALKASQKELLYQQTFKSDTQTQESFIESPKSSILQDFHYDQKTKPYRPYRKRQLMIADINVDNLVKDDVDDD